MAKSRSLVDEVIATTVNLRPGVRCWFDTLPEDAKQELLAVKKAYNPNQFQKRAYARAIIAAAKARGWKIAGYQQVTVWLESDC